MPDFLRTIIDPMKFLLGISFLFIKLTLLPSYNLLLWMGIAIAIDFVTGFTKAIITNVPRNSNGLRRTIIKFLQYGGALTVGVMLAHTAEENHAESLKGIAAYFNDGLVVFIIYIEVTSIFENLVAMDDKSVIATRFYVPVLKFLTAQFKNLPLAQAAAAAEEKSATATL